MASAAKIPGRVPTVLSLVNFVQHNLGKAEDMVLESKRHARDKIRCDGVRPCASCVRKGMECIERACKDCSREGRSAECTHRKAQAAAMAEASAADDAHDNRPDDYRTPSSEKDYPAQAPPQQRLHLPPISHPSSYPPPPHGMYAPPPPAVHMTHMGPASHYYYPPQGMIGPGQPPQPVMQSYVQHEQRVAYYPAIDPNIDNEPSAGGSSSTYPNNSNRRDGQSQTTGASSSSASPSTRR
ncbi:hypothetical protein DXG01_010212 [Tephrocybe rancida]|nr:hypothetical protein DXG01_010212 [Tephrocybe rancida]